MDQSSVDVNHEINHGEFIADSLVKISSHVHNVLIRRVGIIYPSAIGILYFSPKPVHGQVAASVYQALRRHRALTFRLKLLAVCAQLEALFDVSLGRTRAARRPADPQRVIETTLQNTIALSLRKMLALCTTRLTQYVERCIGDGIQFKCLVVSATAGQSVVFPTQTTTFAPQQAGCVPSEPMLRSVLQPISGTIAFTRSLVFHDPRLSVSFLLHWC